LRAEDICPVVGHPTLGDRGAGQLVESLAQVRGYSVVITDSA